MDELLRRRIPDYFLEHGELPESVEELVNAGEVPTGLSLKSSGWNLLIIDSGPNGVSPLEAIGTQDVTKLADGSLELVPDEDDFVHLGVMSPNLSESGALKPLAESLCGSLAREGVGSRELATYNQRLHGARRMADAIFSNWEGLEASPQQSLNYQAAMPDWKRIFSLGDVDGIPNPNLQLVARVNAADGLVLVSDEHTMGRNWNTETDCIELLGGSSTPGDVGHNGFVAVFQGAKRASEGMAFRSYALIANSQIQGGFEHLSVEEFHRRQRSNEFRRPHGPSSSPVSPPETEPTASSLGKPPMEK